MVELQKRSDEIAAEREEERAPHRRSERSSSGFEGQNLTVDVCAVAVRSAVSVMGFCALGRVASDVGVMAGLIVVRRIGVLLLAV